MKNFYIQTIVLLFVVLAGFTSKTNAQFASSNEVYCYKFEKTMDNGVATKEISINQQVIFINFYEDLAGNCQISIAEAGRKMVAEPNYCNSKAIEDARKGSGYFWKYDRSLSTSSKVTYRLYRTTQMFNPYTNSYLPVGWGSACLSFSNDKTEMIWWFLDDPNVRHYYKLIDPNSLKPNLDFLD